MSVSTELRTHLDEQLDFLHSSAAAYDAGTEYEAKRLATTLRVLLHDTDSSTSLLKHLDVKDRLGFVDTGNLEPPPPPAFVLGFGLCIMRMIVPPAAPEAFFYPPLDKPDDHRKHPPTSFKDWWNLPVLRDQQGHTFSRKDLVLSLAHKDGGAHIDQNMSKAYRALSREGSHGFAQGDGTPIKNSLVHASVRQIAYELNKTIKDSLVWGGDSAEVRNPVCPLPYAEQPKVGRNDPCPCGSGRRFKKCFGQRQARRQMPADPRATSPIPGQSSDDVPGQPRTPEPGPPYLDLDCLIFIPV